MVGASTDARTATMVPYMRMADLMAQMVLISVRNLEPHHTSRATRHAPRATPHTTGAFSSRWVQAMHFLHVTFTIVCAQYTTQVEKGTWRNVKQLCRTAGDNTIGAPCLFQRTDSCFPAL